jgi:fructokinase
VVVTLGAEGVIGVTRRAVVEVPAEGISVVDTVGAGDTFQAAMLTWLAEEDLLSIPAMTRLSAEDLRAALAFAASAAAVTCTRRGADMPRRGDLVPQSSLASLPNEDS